MAGRRLSYAERREEKAAVDDPQVVLEAAGRFLEVRSRSISEVRRRLTSAGYRPELVDGAIAKLVDFGMLDDDTFARVWVESRDRARPRGERAIREELRLKGIDRTTIDMVLAERREAARSTDPDDDGSGGGSRTVWPPSASSRRTRGHWRGSRIPASDDNAPTRSWPATASIRRRVARSRPAWSGRPMPRSRRTSRDAPPQVAVRVPFG